MTKNQLRAAQFLHTIATGANAIADAIDAKRLRHREDDYGSARSVAMAISSIRAQAARAFEELTDRPARDVHLAELNTVSPAPWAKAHKVNP